MGIRWNTVQFGWYFDWSCLDTDIYLNCSDWKIVLIVKKCDMIEINVVCIWNPPLNHIAC